MRSTTRVLALLSILLITDTCIATHYSVSDLGAGIFPVAINDLGQIIAQREDPQSYRQQALFIDGATVDQITHEGAADVLVTGLNNRGQVVGSGREYVGNDHAFVWDRSNGWVSLEPPNVQDSFARAINDGGTIVGYIEGQGVAWNSTESITKLGDLGGGFSEAMSVNSHNDVVGLSGLDPVGEQQHPFIWHDGAITDLNVFTSITLGFQEYGVATGLNDNGLAVGVATAYV
jgi:uncharacterized membrane protein